jgi:hypothetical protein
MYANGCFKIPLSCRISEEKRNRIYGKTVSLFSVNTRQQSFAQASKFKAKQMEHLSFQELLLFELLHTMIQLI